MYKFVVLILVVFTFGLSGVAAQKINEQCVINAWVEDRELPKIDDKIRSQARSSSKSLLEIPFVSEDEQIVKLEIIGYSNKYLKIRKAADMTGKTIFQGVGWILASRVGIGILRADRNMEKKVVRYASPSFSSKKVAAISNLPKYYLIQGFNCFGLKIYDFDTKKSGWVPRESLCEKPEAPCIETWNIKT
jgi:hypothetical protein